MIGDISTAEANKLIEKISILTKNLALSRTLLESKLFPVTTYISVGVYNSFEKGPKIFKEVARRITPEELGRAGRNICATQMNQLAAWAISNYYLAGRQFLLHDEGHTSEDETEDEIKEVKFALDLWKRIALAYRSDGHLYADDASNTINILSNDLLSYLKPELSIPDRDMKKSIKRTAAFLELYSFLEHCECRSGLFNHGPYRINENEVVVFKEFINLNGGDFPWMEGMKNRSDYDNLSIAFCLKDVDVKINDWGTMFVSPDNYIDNITSLALFTREKEEILPVPFRKMENLKSFAVSAQKELFMKMAKWSIEEQVIAGASVYSNFAPITKPLNLELKLELAENVLKKHLPKMLQVGVHPYWQRLFEPVQLYDPIKVLP